MSPACSGMFEHHFLCSICLEVLTDPVTTSCGHNFCKTCISTHWDTSTTSRCPVCNQVFSTKPQLKVNIMMREMVSQFRRESEKKNLETRMCPKHSKPLELFCQSDQTRVCLMCSVLEHRSHQLQQEAEEREAEGLIKELEEEIFELMKRSSEVEAVAQLEDTLSDKMKMMKIKMLEMKRRQQFAVDVTLDPLTANSYLVLSDDGKQVYDSDVKKKLPDNPKRFSKYINVLGKQNFSSGRFYFEVQVKGKTDWDLGVNGYWTVALRDGNVYKACGDPPFILHLKCVPEKVGVFVDYEEGVVSFYDVDAAALIYSFTHCCFTHKLHPYFNPGLNHGGKNSAPLIICPVNQSE
uniref:E3 ubiquitin-protein ligase TRIM21-like n=1 Tax=Gouania willdenowi TaxID=441366 RepID=A0A8C5GTZ2_GOUWI